MLNVVGTPQPIQATSGQYVKATVQFSSTVRLDGLQILFNPGLFASAPSAIIGTLGYSVAYPDDTIPVDMNYSAPPIWKNRRAQIERIDRSNFKIHLYFFCTTKIGFIGGAVSPDHNNPFQPYSGSNVIGFRVTVGQSTATATIPVTLRSFCNPALNFETTYNAEQTFVKAFLPGPSVSDVFIGVYKTSGATNNLPLVEDIGLNYARVGAVSPVGVDLIPNDVISAAVMSADQSNVRVTLDHDFLEFSQDYKLYVVYNSGNGWASCVSSVINRADNVPVIAGDVSFVVDIDGTLHNSGCYQNVPPCIEMTVQVIIDGATYNAALAAAGLPGSLAENFVSVAVTPQFDFNGTPSGSSIPVLSGVTAGNASAITIYTPVSNINYLVFSFRFLVNGITQYIYVPVEIRSVEQVELLGPETLCAEDDGLITINLPSEIGTAAITQYDQPGEFEAAQGVTVSGSTITIDPESIPVGVQRCYEICETSEVVVTQPCVCECECVTLEYTARAVPEGGEHTFDLRVLNSANLESPIVRFQVDHTTIGDVNYGAVDRVLGTAAGSDFYVTPEVELANGCVYSFPSVFFRLQPGEQQVTTREVCSAGCNCDEVDPEVSCENYVDITHECDKGNIVITHDQSFASPVVSDEITCSADGGAFGACGAYTDDQNVTVRRRVVFSDGCPPIEATHQAICGKSTTCVNSALLELSTDNDELTLTLTGTYNSNVTSETIYYSLDGGSNFQAYTVPVALDGSETIRAYSATVFSDGCPDVLTPIQGVDGVAGGSDPFVQYCDNEGDVTGFALVTFDAQGNPSTVYFDVNMQETQSVPAGGPCEAFVECLTCP